MALTAGTRLGPYEILSALGAGGMGEVYRARDTTLNRHVAIKVLPESFADDPDRLARFEREAQVLASLNHSNIAHIHGLELSGGVRALVMELVEGEDLSQRIARGALPIEEALAIAKQIAEALEAAHEQGIIHRDLKPANIKVRPDGTVKVLDFGLAKAMEPVSTTHGASLTMSPTLSIHATQAGIILGTAAYMSPEQAAGRPVDTRSDLWSFGVVLLEMLTGQPVFTGETVSHVLAAVFKTEPDWSALPAATPASIRRLLRRCLEKDRKRRLANAADARLEMEDAAREPATDSIAVPAVKSRWRAALPFLAAFVALMVGGTAVWLVMRQVSGPRAVIRSTLSVPLGATAGTTAPDPDLALSADGRRVVYVSRTEGAQTQLYVRALDQLEPTALRGPPPSARSPFLSPDGQWVGFFDGTQALKKVAITGGPVLPIGETTGPPRGASWGSRNSVIFATANQDTGLMEVSADGGEVRVLTKPDSGKGEVDHILPEILPGGDAVLFTVVMAEAIENSKIALLDLKTGRWRVLISGGSNPRYAASGHIVYGVGGTLRAVPFDLDRLEVRGDAVSIVEGVVMKSTGAASFSVASDGAMVYLGGEQQTPERTLVWVDRQGREEPIPVPLRGYVFARLSPDGDRVALDVRDQGIQIWIWTVRGQTFTPLTGDRGVEQAPMWTRRGDRIVYTSGTSPLRLVWRALEGSQSADQLANSAIGIAANSFAPDGSLVFTAMSPKNNLDLYLVAVPTEVGRGTASEPRPLLATLAQEQNGDVSPDGRYLAYQSNESGNEEIHVRPFPDVGKDHWKVSNGGGTHPVWARNGRELFYRAADGKLMATQVETQTTFKRGKTDVAVDRAYFVLGSQGRSYDVSPDGKRFLMIKDAATPTALARQLVMVQNFFEELKRVAPPK